MEVEELAKPAVLPTVLADLMAGGKKPDPADKKAPEPEKLGGSYGFGDRIGDSISLEVNQVTISIQPLGVKKTTTKGPWTCPKLQVSSHGNYY